jgi:uncharacterized protein (UPF0333 family)
MINKKGFALPKEFMMVLLLVLLVAVILLIYLYGPLLKSLFNSLSLFGGS